MLACTHTCTQAPGSSLQGASAEWRAVLPPARWHAAATPKPIRWSAKTMGQCHAEELPQPRACPRFAGIRWLTWQAPGTGRATEWVHARELNTPVVNMK